MCWINWSRSVAVRASWPSTPGVRLPGLSCVTRRTAEYRFARLRSISFIRLRTRLGCCNWPARSIRRLRFLTRCAVAFQSILCHTRGSVLAPMPEAALSFTSIGFRDLDLSVKTRGKWAHFRVRHMPVSCALPQALAFSRILYPLEISASLALGLLVSETPAGLPRSAQGTIGREGSISIPLSVCSCVNQRNDLIDRSDTFWCECVSLYFTLSHVTKLTG